MRDKPRKGENKGGRAVEAINLADKRRELREGRSGRKDYAACSALDWSTRAKQQFITAKFSSEAHKTNTRARSTQML